MNTDTKIRSAVEHWLIELETASSIDALWPSFQAWLREHPRHKEVYLQVERRWHSMDAPLRDMMMQLVYWALTEIDWPAS